MRTYDTGATRDDNTNKPDYKGFTSPTALKAFGAYMHEHRKQADGTLRASDNWKKGIPIDDYVESWYRHTVDFLDAYEAGDMTKCRELACATWFNVQGFLHETLKADVVVATQPNHISFYDRKDPSTHGYFCLKCGYRLNDPRDACRRCMGHL